MKPHRTISDLPQFKIISMSCASSAEGGTTYELAGALDKIWSVRNGRGWLLLPQKEALFGDLKNFDPVAQTAVFLIWENQGADLVGKSLPIVNGYWQPYQVWMIVDSDWPWTRIAFHAQDAFAERKRVDGEESIHVRKLRPDDEIGQDTPIFLRPRDVESRGLIKGGWDHEHCELCWHSIEDGMLGWVDSQNHWLCEGCYTTFVLTHDLSFMDEGQSAS